MPPMPIVEHPDPFLRRPSAPVDAIGGATRELAAAMLETMYAAPGIGLAAVQVGELQRLLVIDLQPQEEDGTARREPIVIVNPEIIERSDELSTYNEGCLSVPEAYADIIRPAKVKARWRDLNGMGHERIVEGLLATVLQHEVDHLDGIMFFDHLSRLKRDMLLKKYLKQRRDRLAA